MSVVTTDSHSIYNNLGYLDFSWWTKIVSLNIVVELRNEKTTHLKSGKRFVYTLHWRQFTTASKHMNRCSTSFVTRKMQIKTTMRCHYMPIRIAIIIIVLLLILISDTTKCGKVVDWLVPSCIARGNAKGYSHFGKQFGRFL